ncbi:hypothetical protein OH492_28695 [Vibrio chagasii]|nr:hypothetical protein [Vibrio chagasii]
MATDDTVLLYETEKCRATNSTLHCQDPVIPHGSAQVLVRTARFSLILIFGEVSSFVDLMIILLTVPSAALLARFDVIGAWSKPKHWPQRSSFDAAGLVTENTSFLLVELHNEKRKNEAKKKAAPGGQQRAHRPQG